MNISHQYTFVNNNSSSSFCSIFEKHNTNISTKHNDSFDSFSKIKKKTDIKQKALSIFFAALIATNLAGCSNKNNVNIIPDNSKIENLDNINDGQLKIDDDMRKSNPELAFGLDLYNEIIKNPSLDIQEHIQKYLNEQNINNIKFVKLDNSSDKLIAGGFEPFYDNDLNYSYGVFHIADLPQDCDNKEKLVYCSVIAHEFQHLMHAQTNDWIDKNSKSSELLGFNEVDAICTYSNMISKSVRNILHSIPPSYLICASTNEISDIYNVKIDVDKANQLKSDMEKYGFFFSEPYSKPIENIVEGAFLDYDGFDKCVEDNFKSCLDEFYSFKDCPETLKNKDGVELIKSRFIDMLINEADSYAINSQMIKIYQGIDPSVQTLNDLTPILYRMVADKIAQLDYNFNE